MIQIKLFVVLTAFVFVGFTGLSIFNSLNEIQQDRLTAIQNAYNY